VFDLSLGNFSEFSAFENAVKYNSKCLFAAGHVFLIHSGVLCVTVIYWLSYCRKFRRNSQCYRRCRYVWAVLFNTTMHDISCSFKTFV